MLTDVHDTWESAQRRLRKLLNEDTYERWIAGIVPVQLDGATFRLGVSNDIFCDWLRNNYRDLIASVLEDVTGRAYRIAFESGHEAPAAETAQAPEKPPNGAVAARPPAPSYRYNRRFTFDTFVVGENSKFPHAAACAVANAPGKAYNPLFIHGATGLGKTHLLQAIAHHVLNDTRRAKVEYVSSEEFGNDFINHLMNRSLPKFRRRYRNVDLLLIDDVHFFKDKEQF